MKLQPHIAFSLYTSACIILVNIKIQAQSCDLHFNVHVLVYTFADNIKMLLKSHLTFHIQNHAMHFG